MADIAWTIDDTVELEALLRFVNELDGNDGDIAPPGAKKVRSVEESVDRKVQELGGDIEFVPPTINRLHVEAQAIATLQKNYKEHLRWKGVIGTAKTRVLAWKKKYCCEREKCWKMKNAEFGTGRFCSIGCSRSFSVSRRWGNVTPLQAPSTVQDESVVPPAAQSDRRTVRCGICCQIGHNRATCPDAPPGQVRRRAVLADITNTPSRDEWNAHLQAVHDRERMYIQAHTELSNQFHAVCAQFQQFQREVYAEFQDQHQKISFLQGNNQQ